MKRAISSLVLVFATTTVGCGMLMPGAVNPGAAGRGGGAGAENASYTTPKESQALIRKGEQDAYTHAIESEEEQLDKAEKDAVKALHVALGKQPAWQGGTPPESSSTALRALKAAKLKVRLEPVTDGDGKAVNDDFLQLKDSYTERVQQLQRKLVEQRASKAEMKEIQSGAKHVMKLNDLRTQVSQVSMATMMANTHVQTSSLQQMLLVAQLVRSRKLHDMQLDASDYALVKRGLAAQKRAEAIAGATMGMLAAYQAVINGDGDPKALDMIAESTAKAFPIKVEVTDEEAKGYVDGLGQNVGKVKGRYEAMLRKVHGDKTYERTFKSGIDAMFAQIEQAQSQKSVSQIANDHWDQYKKDIATCKTKIDPEADARIGPSCKEVFRAAQTGDTSHLLPGVKKAFEETGGMPAGGRAKIALGSKEAAALEGAEAAMNGDVDGTLDAAGKMFPADSTIGASLQGISALKKGDPRGAIQAAVNLVPVPGLKEVFGLASKLLFKG